MNGSEPMDTAPSTRKKDIARLPLFAQPIVASRLARRAALTLLANDEQRYAIGACETIELICELGDGWGSDHLALSSLAKISPSRDSETVVEAIRLAFDSAGAAQGALDFPVDSTVTASALRGVQTVIAYPRFSPLQIMILVESDIDLLTFTCQEMKVSTYDAVGRHVLGRLTPCHPLSLIEPLRNVEEHYR